jgi:hypothetical protein
MMKFILPCSASLFSSGESIKRFTPTKFSNMPSSTVNFNSFGSFFKRSTHCTLRLLKVVGSRWKNSVVFFVTFTFLCWWRIVSHQLNEAKFAEYHYRATVSIYLYKVSLLFSTSRRYVSAKEKEAGRLLRQILNWKKVLVNWKKVRAHRVRNSE